MRLIGLMSGTSLDGIDAALIETDGVVISKLGPGFSRSYSQQERALLNQALSDAGAVADRDARPGALMAAEDMITQSHADAVRQLLAAHSIALNSIDAIAFHGQTVLHRPETGLTVQIGDGLRLAETLGCPVVHDFRGNDMREGGQGAPFAPAFHAALAKHFDIAVPAVFVNIGGVSNVTYVKGVSADLGEGLMAFDTGPGNALIDDFVAEHFGQAYDEGGRIAATGQVHEDRIAGVLALPFFSEAPPKSLDRQDFQVAAQSVLTGLSPADGVATLTDLTAACIAVAARWFDEPARSWIVSGGGAHNETLLRRLRERTGANVMAAQGLGINGDLVEAHAFGYLGARAIQGLPLSFPGTTGVEKPVTGGVVSQPKNRAA